MASYCMVVINSILTLTIITPFPGVPKLKTIAKFKILQNAIYNKQLSGCLECGLDHWLWISHLRGMVDLGPRDMSPVDWAGLVTEILSLSYFLFF